MTFLITLETILREGYAKETVGVLANHVVLNNPSRETISAGLGPVEQYSIILLALIFIGITAYFIKRRKSKSKISIFPKVKRKSI